MSLQLTPADTSSNADSQAVVPFNAQPERLIVDEMGSEMITLYIGPKHQSFSIHKNLICGTGKWLAAFLNEPRAPTQRINLTSEDPEMFKLFVEYLYTKTVPGVRQGGDRLAQTVRLKNLCQLYAFSERFMLDNTVLNKIMDAIQDGYLIVKKFPESGLVSGVYQNTKAGSKLRDFTVHGIIHGLRVGGFTNTDIDAFSVVLRANEEMMGEFLSAVQTFEVPERDPRIRDCNGEAGCVECAGFPGRMAGMTGVWPCAFHVHRANKGPKSEDDSATSEAVDGGCYLWAAN